MKFTINLNDKNIKNSKKLKARLDFIRASKKTIKFDSLSLNKKIDTLILIKSEEILKNFKK